MANKKSEILRMLLMYRVSHMVTSWFLPTFTALTSNIFSFNCTGAVCAYII